MKLKKYIRTYDIDNNQFECRLCGRSSKHGAGKPYL